MILFVSMLQLIFRITSKVRRQKHKNYVVENGVIKVKMFTKLKGSLNRYTRTIVSFEFILHDRYFNGRFLILFKNPYYWIKFKKKNEKLRDHFYTLFLYCFTYFSRWKLYIRFEAKKKYFQNSTSLLFFGKQFVILI